MLVSLKGDENILNTIHNKFSYTSRFLFRGKITKKFYVYKTLKNFDVAKNFLYTYTKFHSGTRRS